MGNGKFTVDASPSKKFFINMLTRDIRLADCILDLIDNSIHSLIRVTGIDVTDIIVKGRASRTIGNYQVSITLSPEEFKIEDNCGGITVDEAENTVFRFGEARQIDKDVGLGVYGIGMKRALFKIGKTIKVISRTNVDGFEVKIDVDSWEKIKPWTFDGETKLKKGRKPGEIGTKIEIKDLNEGVGKHLSQVAFQNDLEERVSRAYALFLKAGLIILINGRKIESTLPEIAEDKRITPVRRSIEKEDVEILIVAGVSGRERGREKLPPKGGWYVFCNGRMILGPDRTNLTGWGWAGVPTFQPKYNAFVGYVYFRSKHLERLPWTTTKNGVVFESPIYQYALSEMMVQTRPALRFLSAMYPGEVQAEGVDERKVLEEARTTTIDQMSKKQTTFKVDLPAKKDKSLVRIQFSRPREVVDKVRKKLGKERVSASKIGEMAFDYYVDKECGRD